MFVVCCVGEMWCCGDDVDVNVVCVMLVVDMGDVFDYVFGLCFVCVFVLMMICGWVGDWW